MTQILAHSRKQLEIFIAQSPVSQAMFDRAMRYLQVSKRWLEDYGLVGHDLIGRSHYDIFPEIPDHWKSVHRRALSGEIMQMDAERFLRANGTEQWLRWEVRPWFDSAENIGGILIFTEDITRRKQQEETIRENEEILSILFNKGTFPATITRMSDQTCINVNDAWISLFGIVREDIIGKNSPEIGEDRPRSIQRNSLIEKLRQGKTVHDLELILLNKTGDEINVLLNADLITIKGEKYVLSTIQDITSKKRSEALIWHQANYDPQTKLPNRRMFLDRFRQHFTEGKHPLALLLVDLDDFKEVNDTLGHSNGDILLVEVARRITACVPESVMVSRLGGDEFTILLTEPEDLDHTEAIAKKIVATLSSAFILGEERVYISASMGIACYPEHASEENLLRYADLAMYAAKNSGRNRYYFYNDSLQARARSRMQLTNDLHNAIAEHQFEVYYQPIIELATEAINKAEALIRWQHPVRGMVCPDDFIAIAEISGMILDIGEWVFKESATQVRRLREMGYPTFQINVNISPIQFRKDHDLTSTWLNYLTALGLPAQSVGIEITEGLLLDLNVEVKEKLFAFRDAGISMSLDDFGTGYSSLAYLKKFDIDYLKIDRAFVTNLETDSDDRALCEAIIVMAHKLGLKVVAEGVETTGQKNLLMEFGCDFAQGYLFSKPIPAVQFEKLLHR